MSERQRKLFLRIAERIGNPTVNNQGNPSGSIEIKNSLHAQRIGFETAKAEYNKPTSPRLLLNGRMKRYAELLGN